MADKQIISAVDRLVDAREELIRRGLAPGDALVVIGCALGTMLGGKD